MTTDGPLLRSTRRYDIASRPPAFNRACRRVRQFHRAILAHWSKLTPAERVVVERHLPPDARVLFERMARAEQRHSLSVFRALEATGVSHPALGQAALLHDCAKSDGGLHLWHKVAIVLVAAFRRDWIEQVGRKEPAKRDWRYPFWLYANHPRLGAQAAEAAGCDPLAARLILRHQESGVDLSGGHLEDELLWALQSADNDN